jgi:hypothetical protein
MGHGESPRHLALIMAAVMVPSGLLMLLTLNRQKPTPAEEPAPIGEAVETSGDE